MPSENLIGIGIFLGVSLNLVMISKPSPKSMQLLIHFILKWKKLASWGNISLSRETEPETFIIKQWLLNIYC